MATVQTVIRATEANDLPELRLHGDFLVVVQKGNNGVNITARTRKQMVKFLRDFRDQVTLAIDHLDTKEEEK